MFETIRTSPYNDGVLLPWVKHFISVAMLAILFCSPVPAVWAAQFKNADIGKGDKAKAGITNDEIAKALIAPPNVPQDSQNLATSFLDHTLPKLLTDDDRLARQLGFGGNIDNPVTVDRALPLMLIRRDDVIKLLAGKLEPIDLVNNTNNWTKDEAGKLAPNRIVFSLKANTSTSEAGPYSWSSVTVGKSREGSWRIIQVGAPKLSRAMRQYEDREANHFLVWLPDLNRHYLGQISAGDEAGSPTILLTTLFDDRLIRVKDQHGEHIRKAGEKFVASSKEFVERLKQLYEDLDLPKKLRDQSGHTQDLSQTQMRP